MTDGRHAVAATALTILIVTSGCIGFFAGDEPLTVEASEGSVSASTVSDAGYEHVRTEPVTINRTVEVAGQSRDIQARNYLSEYQKTVSLPTADAEREAAVFAVFTTPQVEFAGRTFNPVGEMENRELLERLQSRYDEIDVGERTGEETVRTLGTDATVETFDGSARLAGVGLAVEFQIAKVEHDEDFVIAVAVYPEQLPGEDEHVRDLIRNLQH